MKLISQNPRHDVEVAVLLQQLLLLLLLRVRVLAVMEQQLLLRLQSFESRLALHWRRALVHFTVQLLVGGGQRLPWCVCRELDRDCLTRYYIEQPCSIALAQSAQE